MLILRLQARIPQKPKRGSKWLGRRRPPQQVSVYKKPALLKLRSSEKVKYHIRAQVQDSTPK